MDTPQKGSLGFFDLLPWVLLLGLSCILFWLLLGSINTTIEQPITNIITPSDASSSSPMITIEGQRLFITPSMLSSKDLSSLRPYIMRQLIAHGFTSFIQQPYAGSGDNVITSISMQDGYEVLQPIDMMDDLDMYIQDIQTALTGNTTHFIDEEERTSWSGLYLFKTTQDLKTMGYKVVSHRQRENNDRDYRRFNIAQSFALLGNVRILLPGEEFDFMVDAQYDEEAQENYVEGYAIIEGEEEKDYGGGICGASTAIYQGILTNTGLEVTKLRNHSKRFSNLYNAHINHEQVATPGIDSAVYYKQIDLTMTNITPNPILLIMNYDGTSGGTEEVFTLSLPATQGMFEFVSGGKRRGTREIAAPEGTGTISQSFNAGGCYTRLINGEEETNCYKEVR